MAMTKRFGTNYPYIVRELTRGHPEPLRKDVLR